MLQRIRHFRTALCAPELIAAVLLLAVGAGLRLYNLGHIPPAFFKDEATAAYDAWALLHYGIDRNGFSWPVHFFNWGNGQSVLYSYLAMPFIALGGLAEGVFRLPMALGGVLALVLIWRIGARAAGRRFALLLLLLLAFNSWHLPATRFGLDANLLPLVLLLSVYFLSRPDRGRFLIQALAVFILALSAYAYSLAYFLAPLLLGLALLWLALNRLADWRRLLALAAIAFLTALPLILLVIINFFDLESLAILGVSIPRFSGTARYAEVSFLFRQDGGAFLANLPNLAGLLLGREDGSKWNALAGYGALPPLAILLSLPGLGVTLYRAKVHRDYGLHLLLAGWFAAALLTALLVEVNINRANALWLPAVYLMGLGIFLIGRGGRRRPLLYILLAAYGVYSGFFLYQYFGPHTDPDKGRFNTVGRGDAIRRALNAAGDEVIYVTRQPAQPGIDPLFYGQIPPREYRDTRILALPNAAFHYPLAYGQFIFISPLESAGLDNLDPQLRRHGGGSLERVARDALTHQDIALNRIAHYVLHDKEAAQAAAGGLAMERYGNYYYAHNPAAAAAGALRGPLLRIDRPPAAALPTIVQERFNLYRQGNRLTYYKAGCTADDTREEFFLHLFPADAEDLPPAARPHGFANGDFAFGEYGALYGANCWAVVPLPDYPIDRIRTGQYVPGRGPVWQAEFAGER